jgi:ABC-type sugar transport system permease subunit
MRSRVAPYVFISPFYIAFATFMVGPILMAFYAGFTSWRLGGVPEFIGLSNYLQLARDHLFRTAVRNTLFFTIVFNALVIPAAFLLALALNSKVVRFKRFFRTTLFAPITASFIALAIVFDLMLHRDFGFVNLTLNAVGLSSKVDWLKDPRIALWSFVLMRTWRTTGYYMAIMFAGLQALPEELFDAARVDGAGPLARTLHITLPLMKPILVFVAVMSSIFSLQLFDEPWVLNQGGPNYSTLTVVMYLYRTWFGFHNLGYASAISFALSLMMFGFSYAQLRLAREGEQRG